MLQAGSGGVALSSSGWILVRYAGDDVDSGAPRQTEGERAPGQQAPQRGDEKSKRRREESGPRG